MKTVYDALDPIVNGSATTKEKGDKYEAACVYYLKNDPFYALFFSRVGTIAQALEWDDCPVHDTQDNGIDLMAQTAKAGGNYSCSTISRTITVTADPQPAAAEQPAA